MEVQIPKLMQYRELLVDADDYVQAVAAQTSGGNLDNNGNIALSNFSGHLLMAT